MSNIQFSVNEVDGIVKIFPLKILVAKEYFLNVDSPIEKLDDWLKEKVRLEKKHHNRDISILADLTLYNAKEYYNTLLNTD